MPVHSTNDSWDPISIVRPLCIHYTGGQVLPPATDRDALMVNQGGAIGKISLAIIS